MCFRIVFYISLIAVLTNCSYSSKTDTTVTNDILLTNNHEVLKKVDTDSIFNLYKLPLGEVKLINTNFPIRWEIFSSLETSNIENKININFDTISINLTKLFNSNTNALKNNYYKREESIINSHLNNYLKLDKINLFKATDKSELIGLLPQTNNYKVGLL